MIDLPLRGLSIALLTAGLCAQRTWIVDQNNGPGTNFTDLPPALAAASNGDAILVRTGPGWYSAGTTSKSLRVLGAGTPLPILMGLDVNGLPPGGKFVCSGFRLLGGFRLFNNRGAIHFDHIRPYLFGTSPSIRLCTHVTLTDCEIWSGRMDVDSSSVFASGLSVIGGGCSGLRPTLVVSNSTVTLVNSTVGATLCRFGRSYSAIRISLGHLTLARGCSIYSNGFYPDPAIVATATELVIDPSVLINPPLQTTRAPTWIDTPAVIATGAPPGGTLQVDVSGVPNAPAILALSLPAQPFRTPWGWFGLDPLTSVIGLGGTLDASGQWRTSIPVPPQPSLAGTAVTLQALVQARLAPPTTIVITP